MTDDKAFDSRKATGPVDRILLRGAASGKSWVEVSALTGGQVSPEQAAVRVRDLVEARNNGLTELEKRKLLLDEMSELKEVLQARVFSQHSEKDVNPLIKLFKQILDELKESRMDLDRAQREIDAAHARLWLQAINNALTRMFLMLEARHPDVTKGELEEIFQETMPDVVREIEGHVATDG